LVCPRRYNPFTVSRLMPNAVSAVLGIKYSIKGPTNTVALACAAGTSAIGQTYRAIRDGYLDVALAGGSEYWDDYYGAIFRGFDIANTLVQNCADPGTANCPFDLSRTGFLFSQGGSAVLVLEELEVARKRKAKILAEIVGFSETFDAYSMMSLAPDGSEIERMILNTLGDANITPAQVDYINAHGTGTVANDAVECHVLSRVFGSKPKINSTKSLLGHTIGASGAIEAVVTILSLLNQKTHICKNLKNPISSLNFVYEVEQHNFEYALSHSFAFGGHNAGLAIKRYL
jgi:3-oxoacyl-[acyl-carrier-protein] synthase II